MEMTTHAICRLRRSERAANGFLSRIGGPCDKAKMRRPTFHGSLSTWRAPFGLEKRRGADMCVALSNLMHVI